MPDARRSPPDRPRPMADFPAPVPLSLRPDAARHRVTVRRVRLFGRHAWRVSCTRGWGGLFDHFDAEWAASCGGESVEVSGPGALAYALRHASSKNCG